MHIAYSAISALPHSPQGKQEPPEPGSELMLRYQAHVAACDKYSHEIAAIKQWLPGWEPKFSY